MLFTRNAFRKSNLQRRVMRAPNLQFFGCLKTIKQLKAQVAKRYKTRSLKTVYQNLYLDSKPRNFFIGLVDGRGVFLDFPVEEEEYTHLRQLMSSSPMGAFDMPVDLSEMVMPNKRPTKVIHLQPMSNISTALDSVTGHVGIMYWPQYVTTGLTTFEDIFDCEDVLPFLKTSTSVATSGGGGPKSTCTLVVFKLISLA